MYKSPCFRELRKALSVVSAFKKKQAKRRLVRRQRRMMMATAPNAHMHVKKLTMEEGVCSKCLSLDRVSELGEEA